MRAYHFILEEAFDLLLEKQIKGLKNKSEKTNIPYGILKQVYNRGMAAWKTGHRPGAGQQQWAFARVNSFITGGGARKADADLWKKVKASRKKKKKKKYVFTSQGQEMDLVGLVNAVWPILLGFITLVIVLAKMHTAIEVLQEKVKVLFELHNQSQKDK